MTTLKAQKKRLTCEPMQAYKSRDYVLSELDDNIFDTLNDGVYGNFLIFSGCIDALESLPGGSMISHSDKYYSQYTVQRGFTIQELKDFDELMQDIDLI